MHEKSSGGARCRHLFRAVPLAATVVVLGCGRIGFDVEAAGVSDGSADADGAAMDSAMDAPPRDSTLVDSSSTTDTPAADAIADAAPPDASDADADAAAPIDGGPPDGGPLTCPPTLGCITDSYLGIEYCFCGSLRNWVSARAACQAVGLDLVRLTSLAQEEFFTMRFSFRRYWIGATDSAAEGDFRWVDGTLLWMGGPTGSAVGGEFTNWQPGQPSDLGGTGVGDCVVVDTTGGWIDDICDSTRAYRFVCVR